MNGAIAKLSDSVNDVENNSIIHSQETVKPNTSPTLERTLPSNGEGVESTTDCAAMQRNDDEDDSKEVTEKEDKEESNVIEENENSRTSALEEEGNTLGKDSGSPEEKIYDQSNAKEEGAHSEGDKGEDDVVPMETDTANCNQSTEDSNQTEGQKQDLPSLSSARPESDNISQVQAEAISESSKDDKVEPEHKEKDVSSSFKDPETKPVITLVKKSSRKDASGSGRGVLNSTITPVRGDELADEENMDDDDDMEDDDGMDEMEEVIGGNGQRMTRSRTRKAK